MDVSLFERLHEQGLIGNESLDRIRLQQKKKEYSIHWELNIMLYAGVLLLCTGLGILVYENIDSIGHVFILLFIALISAGGYYYCYLKKFPFSIDKVNSPGLFFDYLLVLSCLCFILFIGYWQYEYHVFGDRCGLVIFIPMVLFFFTAYYFDHIGVLCLAISHLAAWAGIVVTPARILRENNFNNETIIFIGLALAILFMVSAKLSLRKKFKTHFAFTYYNFGMNMLFIFCLAGMFHFDKLYLLWFALLGAIAFYFYGEAVREKSFYILLMLCIYAYIGMVYVIFSLPVWNWFLGTGAIMLVCLYFIFSGVFLARFLIRMNKNFNSQ